MSPPVRVALDINALQVDGYADRGIGRYVAGYARGLARTGRLAAALLAPELQPPYGLPSELVVADLVRWDSVAELRRLLDSGPIAYHVTAPFLHSGTGDSPCLGIVPHWAEAAVPRVVTLHDLIPMRAPEQYLDTATRRALYHARARWVASADLILADSDFTRAEAIELLGCRPDQIVTAGVGVSSYFCPPDGTDDAEFAVHFPDLVGRPFLLTVGGSDARKGMDRAIAALGRLAERGFDHRLLIVGDLTTDWRERLTAAARSAGVRRQVMFAGAVSDELLRACYRRADATLMPSLAEGAGLPVLESAASGTPALASASTALAETAATPLALFDPTDPDSIAESVARLLGDDRRRADVLAAQAAMAARSTWAAVVSRGLSAIDDLAQRIPDAAWEGVRPPRRLAFMGPMAPAGGGIGEYDAAVLAGVAALTGAAGRDAMVVDAIVPVGTAPDVPPEVGVVRIPAFGVDVRPSSYDEIVYVLGNSSGHLATVQTALRYPGWLWLHEVRLPALASTALEADQTTFAAKMSSLLRLAYPGRAPLRPAAKAGPSNLDLIHAGVGLTAPLVAHCRGVLVNSQLARRLLLLDLPPMAAPPDIRVMPPACPPVRHRRQARGHLGAGRSRPLLIAFGIVSMAKRPDLLIDAIALTGCDLAFVGPCLDVLRGYLEHRAAARGVSERVEITGEVDRDGWDDWLARADLAVQLRQTMSGETSAAVLEALAAGVPVVTNIASAAELPSGTVSFLPSLEAADIATRISALTADPAALGGLSEAGQAFAADHQFSRLAAALLEAVGG